MNNLDETLVAETNTTLDPKEIITS
jgi:hypothetical protein